MLTLRANLFILPVLQMRLDIKVLDIQHNFQVQA